MDSNVQQLIETVHNLKVEIISLNERLNRGLGQLHDVEKKSEGIDKAMMVIPTVESLRCEMANVRTEFLNRDGDNRKTIAALSGHVMNLSNDFKDLKEDLKSLKECLATIRADYKHDHDNLEGLILHLNGKTSNELQSRLEALHKDLVVSPKDIAQQNSTLLKRIEAASMDGVNAMQKVNAQDLNLRILDKKIENLAIQIKRIDLTKQLGE